MSSLVGIVLAAGKGTRMKSDLPKCVHKICGLPMAEYVGRAMHSAGVLRPIMVIGHGADAVCEILGAKYDYVLQEKQLGTGHAVLAAKLFLEKHNGPVFISNGDAPLLSSCVFKDLLEHHMRSGADLTFGTAIIEDPQGYGRVVRNANNEPTAIVEEKEADEKTKGIREVSVGIYCIESKVLLKFLPMLGNSNAQGEYYITDLIRVLSSQHMKIAALQYQNPDLLVGVNDRWQLAEVAAIMRSRILKKHALNGVTILDPLTSYIDSDVTIGHDTIIKPMTSLEGDTTIGSRCTIGPYTNILNSTVGDDCTILMSYVNSVILKREVRCGPYAHLRPDTVIGESSRIGNYVEIKNAEIGENVSISHLSYVGDATVGNNTNIGAGAITCNYDGFIKHRTEIGENVFIGSNSTLIAPLRLGSESVVGAGSVVTRDVPDGALAIGRVRQEIKEQWSQKWRQRK